MSGGTVLAVDGGNSKTDLALVRDDGALLAYVRGPASSPHHLGVEGALDVIDRLLDEAVVAAGWSRNGGPVVDEAHLLLAGVDFPAEEEVLLAAANARGWAGRVTVGNDTFAVLRTGTERGWGVAIVCGAGINCLGVAPDGRQARFPSLGDITGDWGGGKDVGMAALAAAARSEDGRGPTTTLEQTVPAHFGLTTPLELAQAIHGGTIRSGRLAELAPGVFELARVDAVAASIIGRLVVEIVDYVRAALVRLDLTQEAVEVLLGGGLVEAGNGQLVSDTEAGLRSVGPSITVRAAAGPPIVGASLLGLDAVGAAPDAKARLRRELGEAAAARRRHPSRPPAMPVESSPAIP